MGSAASVADQTHLFNELKVEYEKAREIASAVVPEDEIEEESEDNVKVALQPLEEKQKEHDETLFRNVENIYQKWYRSIQFKSTVLHCELTSLEFAVRKAYDTNLTPIVLDTSVDDKVCTFFSYQPDMVILEAKSLIFDARKDLLSAMEKARRALVSAMKHGKTLVIRLGTTAPDFNHTLNDGHLSTICPLKQVEPAMSSTKTSDFLANPLIESYFPREVFINGGAALHSNEWIERLYRPDDMKPHKHFAICRDEFRVLLASQLSLDNVEECLWGLNDDDHGCLPDKSNFKVINVTYEPEEEEEENEAIQKVDNEN